MTETTCAVCCENTDSVLACPACEYNACHNCVQTFVVSKLKEPACMKCNKGWTREFVMENCDTSWVKSVFRPHIGDIILEQEKALLPNTQKKAANTRKLRELRGALRSFPKNRTLDKIKDPVLRQGAYAEKRAKIHAINLQLLEIALDEAQEITSPKHKKQAPARDVYIANCPIDGCRGFVSQEGVCATCDSKICKKCMQPDQGAHTCNSDDVESAKLIARDTKPCPRCYAPIFKAGGCDQMWCVTCKTTFSWDTSEILSGPIHNPHYYEWLAQQSSTDINDMNLENIACGDVPGAWEVANVLERRGIEYWIRSRVLYIHRSLQHVRYAVIPTVTRPQDVTANEDLRVAYLLGDVSIDQWKSRLLHRERRRMRAKVFHELLELTMLVLSDMIRRIMYNNRIDYQALIQEFNSYCAYYKNTLDRIASTHGGSVPANIHYVFGA